MIDCGSLVLCFLVVFFGISSWISMNGVWVELPQLINVLPQAWKLPTYVVVIVQAANFVPFLYLIVNYFKKFNHAERIVIYIILIVGIICCGLLSKFWNQNSLFFVLIFFLAMVDTTSSVTFLPYLIDYPRYVITALYVGEGFSGLIPGVAGLVQGVSDDLCNKTVTAANSSSMCNSQRYTVSTFFIFLLFILVLSFLSFTIVDNLHFFQQYKIIRKPRSSTELEPVLLGSDSSAEVISSESGNKKSLLMHNVASSTRIKIMLIIIVGYINFLTIGFLPTLQSYIFLPYSMTLYHSVVTVSQILNPLACMVTLRKWEISSCPVITMTLIASLGSFYLIFLAFNTPCLFKAPLAGPILASVSWFIVGTVFSFEKTLLALELQKAGHFWLQLCGASTQIGSALGAVTTLILMDGFDLLHKRQC